MKKLFLLLCVWATLPAVAQTSKDKTLIIDASYLKQGSSYGQLGVHFNYYDSKKLVLSAGLAGHFRSGNGLVAIPEAQLSAWIRADNEPRGFIDIPVLLLRPQLNVSPYYFAPEAGFQILFLYVKAGYAFPWGKMSDNYPFDTGKFRLSVGAIIPQNLK